MARVFDITLGLALEGTEDRPLWRCTVVEAPHLWTLGRSREEAIAHCKARAFMALANRVREGEMPDLEVVMVDVMEAGSGQGGGSGGSVQGKDEQSEREDLG